MELNANNFAVYVKVDMKVGFGLMLMTLSEYGLVCIFEFYLNTLRYSKHLL